MRFWSLPYNILRFTYDETTVERAHNVQYRSLGLCYVSCRFKITDAKAIEREEAYLFANEQMSLPCCTKPMYFFMRLNIRSGIDFVGSMDTASTL
uniref:AlNc14C262G9833 protein n=1 Tax=Albugo laibachii Nc14 TaxID=890382 RepID=F0WU10_9STRA|nr:AlNc14C262G9833 [Albugo laibachii Nc14]|eukprot:CCA24854.1 AlNc14C262G9833 [Albugo laibachii Nc14]